MTPSSFNDRLLTLLKCVSGKRVLVAFSGGKDSLALLHFAACNRKSLGIALGACYINHGLRESAREDEAFCKCFCSEHRIAFWIENIAKDLSGIKGESFEALARRFRYKKLCEVARNEGYSHILTAHTEDDAIETFLLDLFQGASLDTLEGIRRSIIMDEVVIFRPMLEVSTKDVEDYLALNGLSPSFDETNNDTKFRRNLIRHKVMPVINKYIINSKRNIIKLQKESAQLADYLDRAIALKLKGGVSQNGRLATIELEAFNRLELLEKKRFLSGLFSSKFRLSTNILDDSLALINGSQSRRIDLPNDYLLERSYKNIRLLHRSLLTHTFPLKEKGVERLTFETELYRYSLTFKRELKDRELSLRFRKEGDRLRNKRIKDLFIDKKVELFDRDTAIIIEGSEGIIFIEEIYSNEDIIFNKIDLSR